MIRMLFSDVVLVYSTKITRPKVYSNTNNMSETLQLCCIQDIVKHMFTQFKVTLT